MNVKNHTTQISNILVIGCGGAGLRAAIEVKLTGLEVQILGKRPKTDAHTVLAAGGINAAFGNVDKADSWEQHFVDTYQEGYGIADPTQIEIMAKESPSLVKEIDSWGANFAKLSNGKLFFAQPENGFIITYTFLIDTLLKRIFTFSVCDNPSSLILYY